MLSIKLMDNSATKNGYRPILKQKKGGRVCVTIKDKITHLYEVYTTATDVPSIDTKNIREIHAAHLLHNKQLKN